MKSNQTKQTNKPTRGTYRLAHLDIAEIKAALAAA